MFLKYLHQACQDWQVKLHAYVLMDNHVHLLLAAEERGRVSSAVAVCSHRYVRYFNFRRARVGTLFQGRFKSCLVDSEGYVLRVIRYIELNPVRAALASRPQAYRWSSARAHLGLRHDPLVAFHPAYEHMAKALLPKSSGLGATYRPSCCGHGAVTRQSFGSSKRMSMGCFGQS